MKFQKKSPLVDEVAGNSVYTVLDFKCAFWSVQLSPKAALLCAFGTPFGIYKLERLAFGLSVSSEIFQSKASEIFCLPNVFIYIDDLIIAAKSVKEHDETLLKVLKIARENNAKFNGKKIQFRKSSATYLGYVLSSQGKEISPDRIKAIEDLPIPTVESNCKEF